MDIRLSLKDELECGEDNCNKIEIKQNRLLCLDKETNEEECKSLRILCDGNYDCLNRIDELNSQKKID